MLGLDVGIASCGWAVVDNENKKILGMGVHCFDPAEDPESHKLKNKARREKRGQRRVIHRRAQRMKEVRRLIRQHNILPEPSPEFFRGLGKDAPDPWQARAEGLKRALEPAEAAAALIHLAKHRGFKSNSKSDQSEDAPPDSKKMLKGMSERREKMKGRTYGQAIFEDEQHRKRNRDGEYNFTPMRKDIEEEAQKLIQKQKENNAAWATEKFENAFVKAAFSQRSLQSSQDLVGACTFETDEKRTAKHAYSFEKFRLLQKIVWIETDDGRLTTDQIAVVMKDFGSKKSMNYKQLKKKLGMPKEIRFKQAPDDENEKENITGSSRGICPGTYILRKALSKADWQSLAETPAKLDRIAEVLTFNEDLAGIEERLKEDDSLGLSVAILKSIMDAAREGKFSSFKGAAHISAKAARNIIPGLEKGMVYSDACEACSYDHAAAGEININAIRNTVVRRSLNKVLKQVKIISLEYGKPKAIHVELLREVGKSAKQRENITNGLKKRTGEKEDNRKELADLIGCATENVRARELEMYELLKEQTMRCAYCEREIKPTQLQGNYAQIDHIWPRSLFSDNSFVGKVLTCIKCNQDKKQQTPWEWYEAGGFPTSWENFEARVRGFSCKAEKKRRLFNKNFRKRLEDEQFANRHRVDSSYVARTLLGALRKDYPQDYEGQRAAKGGTRRLLARPGQLTAVLRTSWLSEVYKKDREDDRHHAIDALVVACCSERTLKYLTKAYQALEKAGKYKWLPKVELPWESFREDVVKACDGWLVCRTETRRVRGPGHKETIRRAREDDEGKLITYERKKVEELNADDLNRIPGPECNQKLIATLQKYVQHDKKTRQEYPPRSPKGDVIRKVRLMRKPATSGAGRLLERSGKGKDHVDSANMVRVDVYHVKERRIDSEGRRITPGYYLVPIYSWQIMNKKSSTPIKAILAHKHENEWPEMEQKDFMFSLYKDSYIKVICKNDEIKEGYYRKTDRSSASICLSLHNRREKKEQIRRGVKTCRLIGKHTVDRLGIKHKIEKEKWPGEAST